METEENTDTIKVSSCEAGDSNLTIKSKCSHIEISAKITEVLFLGQKVTPCKNEKCNEPIFYQSDKIVVEDHEHSWQHYDSINQICHYKEKFVKRNEKTIFTVAFFDKL